MKDINYKRFFILVPSVVVGVLVLTSSVAFAALTISGTGISGDGVVAIDSSSTITVQPGNQFTISGCTTTANASADITASGAGCAFLSQIGSGSRITLSSDPTNFCTVVSVPSNTELLLDNNGFGDSCGNGTSQTITVYPAAFGLNLASGQRFLTTNDQGHIAIGFNDYTNTGVPAAPVPGTFLYSDQKLDEHLPQFSYLSSQFTPSAGAGVGVYAYKNQTAVDGTTGMAELVNTTNQMFLKGTGNVDGNDGDCYGSAVVNTCVDTAIFGNYTINRDVTSLQAYLNPDAGGTASITGNLAASKSMLVADGAPAVTVSGAAAAYMGMMHTSAITAPIAATFYGIRPSNVGSINTLAGLYLENMAFGQATHEYAIDTEGGTVLHKTGNAGTVGMEIQRTSSQTANLFQLLDTDGTTVLATFDKNGSLAIGTTTPQGKLDVSAGANATTTVTIGELGLTTSKGCVNMNRANGQPGSFYISATGSWVVETNYCR